MHSTVTGGKTQTLHAQADCQGDLNSEVIGGDELESGGKVVKLDPYIRPKEKRRGCFSDR